MTDADTPTRSPGGSGRPAGLVTVVAGLAVVVAAVAALWFGVGWTKAAFFTDVPRADAREAALDGARQAGLNLASMNPDDIDGSIRQIKSSMTGEMLDYFTKNSDRMKQAAEQTKTRLTSKVVGSSLSELDSERSRAKAIVVLRQVQTPAGGRPQEQRVTWLLDMAKTDGGWKSEQATSLGPPVLLDARAPAPAPQPDQPQPAKPGA